MKRFFALVVPVAILAGGLLTLRGGGSGDGPLDGDEGGGHGSPVHVNAEYDSFSVLLQNLGDKPIEIDRIRLIKVSGPVQLSGVRARLVPDEGPAGGGGLVGSQQSTTSVPLSERNILPVPKTFTDAGSPDQALQILFRVKMTEEGIGHSAGVEVQYHTDGKNYTEVYPFFMTLCAPREKYLGEGIQQCDGESLPEGKRILG